MVTIKNKTKLVEDTENPLTQKARQLALDCLEYAVNAVDPKKSSPKNYPTKAT